MTRVSKCIFFITVMIFGALFILNFEAASDRAYAKDRPVINSFDDFYKEFAEQIHDRKALKYYEVPDRSLGKELVYQELTDFGRHFNPDDPLLSGCYLVYYLKAAYFTYEASVLKVMIEFPYNGGEMDAHFTEMDRLAVQLKKESDYETVKAVHDYLIDNFDYDKSTDMVNHTDIDGFRDKKMVCSGYGLATYYLLNRIGIETRIVTGCGGEKDPPVEDHMWNLVRLDGKWYNLDVTWDDNGGTNKSYIYFLKSDADFPMHIRMEPYNTPAVAKEISQESYPIPWTLRLGAVFREKWYVFVLIIVALIMMIRYILRVRGVLKPRTNEEYKDASGSMNGFGYGGGWYQPYNGPSDDNSYNNYRPADNNSYNSPTDDNSYNRPIDNNSYNRPTESGSNSLPDSSNYGTPVDGSGSQNENDWEI